MMRSTNLKWIIALLCLTGIALAFGIATIYFRLMVQDREVLICHLALNDVSCLTTNGIDALAKIKDRQMWFYYKEFNSTLKNHPGRDYFLWRIQQAATSTSNEISRRGVLSEEQISQLLRITNSPTENRNYYFDR